MPEEQEAQDAKSSVQVASEEEAKATQDRILGIEEEEAKPAEEKPGETKGEVEEKEKPKAEEEAEKAKPAKADEEEEKISKILARFKDTPEADKPKALAKAYREIEKLHGEQGKEIGDLRKTELWVRQLQEDLQADFAGTVKKLETALGAKEGEEAENVVAQALEDPKVLKSYVQEQIAEHDANKRWNADQEELMKDRHKDWDELADKRNALMEAVRLQKFPYNKEIFHLAVRGSASPEKLLEDAKAIVAKETADALAAKMDQQTQTQAGGAEEKKEPTYQEKKEGSILTSSERAAG